MQVRREAKGVAERADERVGVRRGGILNESEEEAGGEGHSPHLRVGERGSVQ